MRRGGPTASGFLLNSGTKGCIFAASSIFLRMAAMSDKQRLEHFPINIFPIVMGLTGCTLAWQKAQHVLGFDYGIAHGLTVISLLVFVVLATLYMIKLARYPQAVSAEIKHPIKLSFFPSVSISLILIGTTLQHIEPSSAHVIWLAGVFLQFFLLLFVISSWVNHAHFETVHVNPSWFIPAVGNVLVPIAGIEFGHVELSWFFFSVGMVFWVILLTIVFNRILFHNPMPPKLLPTLAILIAPPAVGFVAYFKLVGGLDSFGRVLYFAALFFTIFVVSQAPRFIKLPFFLSWWAYSFPVAAMTVATWIMFEVTKVTGYKYLAIGLLVFLSLVIIFLTFKTILAVINKKICLPD
jgi:tellurite resistance protein